MADITREDLAGLIRDEYASIFTRNVNTESAVIRAFGSIPLNTKSTTTSVLASLPTAGWVSEDFDAEDGVKPTSKITWGNKNLVAEELAVIIPVHENVLADATEDIVSQIVAEGSAAIARALDAAVLFGVNKPTTWTDPALFQAATAAGNIFQASAVAGEDDLAGSILQAASAIAVSGGTPSKILVPGAFPFKVANLRDGNGGALFNSTVGPNGITANFAGVSTELVTEGFDVTKAEALVVDASRVKIGVRSDIQVKLLTEATIAGKSLAERDMVAFRFVARYGYALGNVLSGNNVTAAPVAAVTPAV